MSDDLPLWGWAHEYDGPTVAKFQAFHRAHPEVLEAIKYRTDQLMGVGRRHYGMKAIFEVIRFHSIIDCRDVDIFKINNNWAPFYARIMNDDPKYRGFFALRHGPRVDREKVTLGE